MGRDEDIRAYWEDPDTVSLIDENLRLLEERAVLEHLKPGMCVLDVGCGDGRSTIKYAERVKDCIGVERSNHLLEAARARAKEPALMVEGDVRDLRFNAGVFDVVISQRCLINLPTLEDQLKALTEIARVLRPGGTVVLAENTLTGAKKLDALREAVGLEPIPLHWHNRYFKSAHVLSSLMWIVGFEYPKRQTFGLYYVLTRVYANLVASFEGFGKDAKKDPVFDGLDEAARRMQEELGSCDFDCGPIQVFSAKKA